MTRLFIALTLSTGARQFVADAAVRLSHALAGTQADGSIAMVPGVRWVATENYHVTMKFLGEVGEERIAQIGAALDAAAGGFTTLPIRIGGVGTFPPVRAGRGRARPPRTLWIGITEGGAIVSALAAAIDERLAKAGWPRERKALHPHVTIGRVRTPSRRGGRRDQSAAVDWGTGVSPPANEACGETEEVITHVSLVRSELRPSGPVYHVVSRHVLTGDRGSGHPDGGP